MSPALPLLLGLLAFGGALRGAFTGDDLPSVLQHPVVTGAEPLSALLRYNHHGAPIERSAHVLRPLATLLNVVEYRLWGPRPLPFHLVSLVLYLMTVWIGQLCLRELLPAGYALAGAAIFAVLGIHVETVAAVANRSEVLALLFVELGLLAVLRERLRWAVPAYVAALLSKEVAFLLPLVVAWYWWTRDGLKSLATRRRAAVLVALSAVGAAYLAHRLSLGSLHESLVPADNPLLGRSLDVRTWMSFALLGRYLRLAAWPRSLAFDYSYSVIDPLGGGAGAEGWIGLAAIVTMLLLGLRALWRGRAGTNVRAREGQLMLFAAGGWLASYLLVSNSLVLITIIFAERLFFGPSFWLVLFGLALAHEAQRSRAWLRAPLVAAALLVVLIQLPLAMRGTAAWRDELSLARAQVAAQPASVKGQLYYAQALVRAGRIEQALLPLALAIHGRTTFPAPWSPPVLGGASSEGQLVTILRLLDSQASLSSTLAQFRGIAEGVLGRPAALAVDRLAARLAARRAAGSRAQPGSAPRSPSSAGVLPVTPPR